MDADSANDDGGEHETGNGEANSNSHLASSAPRSTAGTPHKMGFWHSRTRHVPDLLKLRARIADHLGNRAEAAKIGLYLLQGGLARIRCHIDQKTDFWERHFDFLKQLCAATVESRLGVNRHGFELDAVFLRAFVADDVGAGD